MGGARALISALALREYGTHLLKLLLAEHLKAVLTQEGGNDSLS